MPDGPVRVLLPVFGVTVPSSMAQLCGQQSGTSSGWVGRMVRKGYLFSHGTSCGMQLLSQDVPGR